MTLKPAKMRSRSIPKVSTATLLAGALLLTGCGGGSSYSNTTSTAASTASAPAATPTTTTSSTPSAAAEAGKPLSVEANPEGQLKYSTTSLSAKAGAVSIDFTNMSSLGHNITVASASGETVGETPTFQGGSKTLALNLKPGTYKFFCSVPGHRAAGMEGTLTVK